MKWFYLKAVTAGGTTYNNHKTTVFYVWARVPGLRWPRWELIYIDATIKVNAALT